MAYTFAVGSGTCSLYFTLYRRGTWGLDAGPCIPPNRPCIQPTAGACPRLVEASTALLTRMFFGEFLEDSQSKKH